MSAYIVNPDTISRIAIVANAGWDGEINVNTAKRDAVRLLNENIESVVARYPDINKRDAVSNFITGLNTITFLEKSDTIITPVVAGSTFDAKDADWCKYVWRDISEYIYQSCEHDTWEGSEGQLVALNAAYWVSNQLLEDVA